jgi:nifR3 family TIM-barrel protein
MTRIGSVDVAPSLALAPMAGMTDTAFRRLVKRRGGCGLVVTEMVSSEGLVRGIDRTLEYAEYTEEERPVSIQIFGGDPDRMAEAARIVEGMGADIVDVNMGCPVPKISKHHAGCSLMRDPDHAARIVAAMVRKVRIPVTVKMRAGWDERTINAPLMARRMEDAGAAAVSVHGRTAAQSYAGVADWDLIRSVAERVTIPVLGSGDCVEASETVARVRGSGVAGVLIGRGALRNPWIFGQVADLLDGRPPRPVGLEDRGRFLLEYVDLLLSERVDEARGFRHVAPARPGPVDPAPARGRERWVINKLRALVSWYSKGLDEGSRLRVSINRAESIAQLREVIHEFFLDPHGVGVGVLRAEAVSG